MANVIWNPGINAYNPTVEMIVNQTSQDVAGNYSIVTWSLVLHRPSNVTSSSSKAYSAKIDGVTVASGTTTLGGSGDKIIASGTAVIYHNADGTRTGVPFSFTMDIGILWSGSNTGNASGSGSINLTTIPRASSGSLSNPSPNLGDTVTINVSRASTAFTHEIYVDWYAGAWTKLTTGGKVATSLSWLIPKTFANNIPNSLSGNGRILIETYNETTLIGSTIFNFTANVPDTAEFKPTISSVSRVEAVAGIATQFGAYVQNKSKLAVGVNASGAYGSSIAVYKTVILGVEYPNQSFTSGELTSSGTVNVVTTVTDSRGRTASVTNTVTVVAYSPPLISNFSGFRSLSNGTADEDDGEYLRAIMKFSVSPVNVGGVNKNTKSYTVEYKLQSSSTWTLLTQGNVYSYDSAFTSASAILNADFAYDVRLTVTDYFEPVTSSFPVGAGFTLLDFSADGKGMAIGKVYGGQAMLEVFGDILIQNRGNDTKLRIEQLQGNAGIEVGNGNLIGMSYVDFHSSGTGSDYDARIIASGGSSNLGSGTLTLEALNIAFANVPKIGGKSFIYLEEQGTNANGTYIKYSDGTMFCFFASPQIDFSIAHGVTYESPQYAYPATFVGSVVTMMQGFVTTGAGNADNYAMIPHWNGSWRYFIRNLSGSTLTRIVSPKFFAIGRWK